jgi:hypothetical protein
MDPTIHCPRCDQEVDATERACPACGHLHHEQLTCARHADRSAAGLCVVCGDAVCDECVPDDRLHFACPAHAAVQVIEGWAQIYSTSDTVEADLIKENLQAEGIDAAVLSQKDRSFNVDFGDLSPVRILVPAYEYRNAVGLLLSHMDSRGEVIFACPACGEAFEVGADACASCGQPLPTAGPAGPSAGGSSPVTG